MFLTGQLNPCPLWSGQVWPESYEKCQACCQWSIGALVWLCINFGSFPYQRPYVYSFWQIFQPLHLFPVLRLFRTLEYPNNHLHIDTMYAHFLNVSRKNHVTFFSRSTFFIFLLQKHINLEQNYVENRFKQFSCEHLYPLWNWCQHLWPLLFY